LEGVFAQQKGGPGKGVRGTGPVARPVNSKKTYSSTGQKRQKRFGKLLRPGRRFVVERLLQHSIVGRDGLKVY